MARVCPECRGEFRDEIVFCPDCETELVAEWAIQQEPAAELHDTSPAVTVFATADLGTLTLAKTLLEDAEIPFAVTNERMLDLFHSSATGPPFESRHRQAEVQVPASRVDEAQAVLEDLAVDRPSLEEE